MRGTSRDTGDSYFYDFDAACHSVMGQRCGSQMNPAVLRVPVTPGGDGINPFRVRFNVDPRDIGLEIRTLFASDFARAAIERGRRIAISEQRERELGEEVAALRRDLAKERQIVSRFERLTGIIADRIGER